MHAMISIVARPPMPWTPPIVLAIMLIASVTMFVALVRRWTSRRTHVTLARWGRERGFYLTGAKAALPLPFAKLKDLPVRPQWLLRGTTTSLLRLVSAPGAPDRRLNVLIRGVDSCWPVTALRPVAATDSVVDLFSLGSFPLLPVNDRYTLHGEDSARARLLGSSPAAGLLPSDVALLLHGKYLVLDFSTRAFDGIEFGRMIALADQLERAIQIIGGATIPA
jgi:hypothetical protein